VGQGYFLPPAKDARQFFIAAKKEMRLRDWWSGHKLRRKLIGRFCRILGRSAWHRIYCLVGCCLRLPLDHLVHQKCFGQPMQTVARLQKIASNL